MGVDVSMMAEVQIRPCSSLVHTRITVSAGMMLNTSRPVPGRCDPAILARELHCEYKPGRHQGDDPQILKLGGNSLASSVGMRSSSAYVPAQNPAASSMTGGPVRQVTSAAGRQC